MNRPLRVNVLLSLREDTLASLDRLKADIPQLFSNVLRLDRLDRAAGRAAIVRPCVAGTSSRATRSSRRMRSSNASSTASVRPHRARHGRCRGRRGERCSATHRSPVPPARHAALWDVERGSGSTTLRAATLDALGGAGEIVADHLERAIDALAPSSSEIAARLFDHLVTPSGTKIAHEISDLATSRGRRRTHVPPVVETLARHRILRTDEVGRWEIFHDVLAGAVLGWKTRYDGKARRGARPRRSTPTASSAWLPRLRRARRPRAHLRARRLRVLPAQRRARASAGREGRPVGRQRSLAAGWRSGARAGARLEAARVDPTLRRKTPCACARASRERAIFDVGHPLVSLELTARARARWSSTPTSMARLLDLRAGVNSGHTRSTAPQRRSPRATAPCPRVARRSLRRSTRRRARPSGRRRAPRARACRAARGEPRRRDGDRDRRQAPRPRLRAAVRRRSAGSSRRHGSPPLRSRRPADRRQRGHRPNRTALGHADLGATHVLLGHVGRIQSVAFDRVGHRVATASTDQTARVWRAAQVPWSLALRSHGAGRRRLFRAPTAGARHRQRRLDRADLARERSSRRDAGRASWRGYPGGVLSPRHRRHRRGGRHHAPLGSRDEHRARADAGQRPPGPAHRAVRPGRSRRGRRRERRPPRTAAAPNEFCAVTRIS